MTVCWAPLTEADVAEWSELANVLAEVDGTGETYQPDDLAEELHEPGVDPDRDLIAVRVGGVLAGYGQLRVSMAPVDGQVTAWLGGDVHPDYRGRGLGRQLMDRLEARAATVAAERHPGIDVLLRASGGIEGSPARPMLSHRGYQIVRYYHDMERELPGEPLPEPALPVNRYLAQLAETTRLAHNDAFSTHWGSSPRTAEQWQDLVGSRTFRPQASFVHLDPAGSVLGYVLVRQWAEGEAWIDLVGTRQQARGRGVARACLTASLRACAEQGYRTAGLGVDSNNGQGAGALYSSVGFRVVRTFASYGRFIPGVDIARTGPVVDTRI
jgi:mycothiol synthase